MPRLYGSWSNIERPEENEDFVREVAVPVNNPLGAAAARQPERNPTTPGVNGPRVPGGYVYRPDTGSLNKDSPAMSREAANDSFANFEDFFNKNTGYAQKYRDQVRSHLGSAPKTENVLPGSVARSGVAVDPGATQAPGFGGIPQKTATSAPVNQNVSVPATKPQDGGNPFTRAGGTQPNTSTAQTPLAGASGGRSSLEGQGGTLLRQTKQHLEDPPTTPKTTTPATPLTDIQESADEMFSGWTNSDGKKSTPQPRTTSPVSPEAAALVAELNALPVGRTPEEDAELQRVSHAEDDVASLGLDEGQALLSELNGMLPNGMTAKEAAEAGIGGGVDPMDAAFMNVAGGRNDRDEYKKSFEGATAKMEKGLTDKYGAVQKRRDELVAELAARKTVSDAAPQPTQTGPEAPGTPIGKSGSHLREKYGTWDDFMQGDGTVMGDNTVKTKLHQVGTDLSLADWSLVEAGKNGVNTPLPMQIFRDIYASNFVGDVSELNNRVAFNHIIDEFGDNAGRWLWDNLTPQDWEEIKGSMNYGYTIHLMQKKMKAGLGEDNFNKIRKKNGYASHTIDKFGKVVPVEKQGYTGKLESGVQADSTAATDEDVQLILAKGYSYRDPKTGKVFKTMDEWAKYKGYQ